jgi:HEAT repeat protein
VSLGSASYADSADVQATTRRTRLGRLTVAATYADPGPGPSSKASSQTGPVAASDPVSFSIFHLRLRCARPGATIEHVEVILAAPLATDSKRIAELIEGLSAVTGSSSPHYTSDDYSPDRWISSEKPDTERILKVKQELVLIGQLAIPFLCKALNHVNRYIKYEGERDETTEIGFETACTAADALGEIGHPLAVPALCDTLNESLCDSGLAARIATALCRIGDLRAVPALCAKLNGCKSNFEPTPEIAGALGTFGDESALMPLWDAYKRIDPCAPIVEAMAKIIGDPLLSLEHQNWVFRAGATAVLGHQRNSVAIPNLIHVLRADQNGDVRAGAAVALNWINKDELIELGEAAVSPLCDVLESWGYLSVGALNRRCRFAHEAGSALGLIGGSRATKALRDAVQDPDVFVAAGALEALAGLGEADLETLREAVRRSEVVPGGHHLAVAAVRHMPGLGDAGFQLLCDSLRYPSDRVASAAAEALALFGEAAVPFLGGALKHWYPRDEPLGVFGHNCHLGGYTGFYCRVSCTVIKALARCGEQALPVLRGALKHPCHRVASAAQNALAGMP